MLEALDLSQKLSKSQYKRRLPRMQRRLHRLQRACSQKFQAPPEFVPQGEMSRDETLKRFAAARAMTLDFVRRTHAPLQMLTAEGPAGKMNVHQWLVLTGGHSMRHSLQIEEVLEQLE